MKRNSRSIWPVLLITLLLGLFAAPVSAQNQPAPNPDLVPSCALDVIFILDESFSLASPSTTPMDEVRASMQEIMEVLNGTGSFVRVVEFNIQSRNAIIDGTTDWQEVDDDYVNTHFPYYINNTIGGASASGYNPVNGAGAAATTGTNWDAALQTTAAIADRVVGRTPLVIILTDGEPNYIQGGGSTVATSVAVNAAIASANTVKAQGRHIFGGGFGAANTTNIIQITGPEDYDDTGNFLTADFLVVDDSTQLADAITQALAGLCAPSLSIKKLVDEGQGYVNAPGWEFSATVEVIDPNDQQENPDSYEWTTPVSGLATVEGTTQSDTTDVDGNTQFAWKPGTVEVEQPWESQVTFTETNQPGYQFVSGECLLRDDDDGTEDVELEITSLPYGPVSLAPNEYLSCEIRNAAEDFTVNKTANPTQVVAPGGPVEFTVRIDNNTDAQITIDSLEDNQFGDITIPVGDVIDTDCSVPQNIAAQGFYECTFTADVIGQAGSTHTNVVTACEGENCEEDDADVDIVGASIEVTKSANPTEVTYPGGPVVYTVNVENTGDVPLTIDSLVDDIFGDVTIVQGDVTATTCDDLPVDLTVSGMTSVYECTFTANVTGSLGSTHTNTVEACDTTSYDEDVCDDDPAEVDIVGEPAVLVTKSANPTQVTYPGGSVVFTVNVANDSDVPLNIDSLTDDIFGDITTDGHDGITATTCALPQAIAVGDDYECTFTATVTGDLDTTHTNTVTACDTTSFPDDVCDEDTADVDIVGSPAITVDKSANPTQVAAPGGPVEFTVYVENTGDVPLLLDSLTDDIFGDITMVQGEVTATTCDDLPVAIPFEGSYQCEFTANVTGEPETTHINTVTACDNTSFEEDICDDDDAEVDIVGTPGIQVIKTANPTQVTAPGGQVVFTVHVDNNGDVPLELDSLTDDIYGNITQAQGLISATTCAVPQVIAVDDDYECTFAAAVNGSPETTHINTVTACDGDLCDDDAAEVDIVGTPEIEVTKTANPTQVTAPGGQVVFTVRVDNTGNVPVTIDSLDDDVYGDITTTGHDTITATTCDVTPGVLLAVDGFYQCTFTATVSGDAGTTHINTVEACDTTTYEGDICDDDDAEVDIIRLTSFCPVENEDVGLSMTSMLGAGQGSTTKGIKTRKIVIPNSDELVSLYGQLAAVDIGVMKYARFLYPNGTFVKMVNPTSPAYRAYAVDWWGTELEPSKFIKGQFFWGIGGNKAPRAFVLWPEYETEELYADVFVAFDESHENHVYWELGWYPTQVQTITIPTTQGVGADITVNVALVDNNRDARPVILTVTAGGVTQVRIDTNPTNGDTLNRYTITLPNVPAGTSTVELRLESPGPNLAGDGWFTGPLGGDSVAMIGASASYLCEVEEGR